MSKITKDDFEAWKANPVTEAFHHRMVCMVEELEEGWIEALEQNSIKADDLVALRMELKAKRELLIELHNATLEDINDSDEEQKA